MMAATLGNGPDVACDVRELQLVRMQLGNVEHVVEHADETGGCLDRRVGELLLHRPQFRAAEQVDCRYDRIERRADFVAHHRDEARLARLALGRQPILRAGAEGEHREARHDEDAEHDFNRVVVRDRAPRRRAEVRAVEPVRRQLVHVARRQRVQRFVDDRRQHRQVFARGHDDHGGHVRDSARNVQAMRVTAANRRHEHGVESDRRVRAARRDRVERIALLEGREQPYRRIVLTEKALVRSA